MHTPSPLPHFHDDVSELVVSSSSSSSSADALDARLLPHASSLRSVFYEVHGCQMNVSDTEIVKGVLQKAGYVETDARDDADVVLLMTCAIREGAEAKIWHKLSDLRSTSRKRRLEQQQKQRGATTSSSSASASAAARQPQVIGVLGCMAERLKDSLLEHADVVCGPDAYRSLPTLLERAEDGQAAVNVALSADETYADVAPVRHNSNGVGAFVSIMRGCNNMCSYCIVPFTRGRERSLDVASIVRQVKQLSDEGYREVTLLGQNVNSYADRTTAPDPRFAGPAYTQHMKSLARAPEDALRFAELLHRVAEVDPEMRVRFTSPHPQHFPDQVLDVIAAQPNVCKAIHLPAQSGSTSVLERMRRGYSREAYLALVERIRARVPNVTLSSDFIAGFCGETEDEHRDTVTLLEAVQYDMAFLFAYSMRAKTHASHRMVDDVPEPVKLRRLQELIDTYRRNVLERHQRDVGTRQLVLVEGPSRRSDALATPQLQGRTDGNKVAVFDAVPVPCLASASAELVVPRPGDYVEVTVQRTSYTTLFCEPLGVSSIARYASL